MPHKDRHKGTHLQREFKEKKDNNIQDVGKKPFSLEYLKMVGQSQGIVLYPHTKHPSMNQPHFHELAPDLQCFHLMRYCEVGM